MIRQQSLHKGFEGGGFDMTATPTGRVSPGIGALPGGPKDETGLTSM